jgi:flagellar hook-basal body complex protein FliE
VEGRSLAVRIGEGLEHARALEREAHGALRALRAGERCDVEGVLMATRKAEAAFQMLQAVRTAMLEAYAEIREMRL